jgi:hypothetical protein
VAQVVEHLPSKRQELISNPSTTKKKKRIKQGRFSGVVFGGED